MGRLMDIRGVCIASVVVQTVIFGSGSAITKLAYTTISPLWCLVFRFGVATLVFALLFGPRIVSGIRRAHLAAWLPAALCMTASYISCNVALDLTTATNVGFLMALPVVFTPPLAALILHRPYRLAYLPFQAGVVLGLSLLCSSGGTFSLGWGEVAGLVTALSLAGALVFGERALATMDVVTVSGAQIALTFVVALIGALLFDQPPDVAGVAPTAWATVVFLALASTCLTFALQNAALIRLPSSTVSMLLTGEPVFTALFSWAILGETLTLVGLAGGALIVACVIAQTYLEGKGVAPALPSPAPPRPGTPGLAGAFADTAPSRSTPAHPSAAAALVLKPPQNACE